MLPTQPKNLEEGTRSLQLPAIPAAVSGSAVVEESAQVRRGTAYIVFGDAEVPTTR